jgi:NhaP-type Na+/H+ or K+/H+ antiporter
VVALALLAYSLAVELGGNGFIAAFVGGLAFGALLPAGEHDETLEFDAQTGELVSLVVWFLFGAVMVSALDGVTWRTVVFVVLGLTAVRMAPVAASLAGSGLSWVTVGFIGWFGPRGLASLVFGLIAFDSLSGPTADVVVSAVTLTVLVSVVAHGITARPFSRRYGTWAAGLPDGAFERPPAGSAPLVTPPVDTVRTPSPPEEVG